MLLVMALARQQASARVPSKNSGLQPLPHRRGQCLRKTHSAQSTAPHPKSWLCHSAWVAAESKSQEGPASATTVRACSPCIVDVLQRINLHPSCAR